MSIPQPRKRIGKNFFPVPVHIQIEFAIRLRRLRLKRGWSQSQVAAKLGVTQQAYAKLETPLSANPTLTTIKKLSDTLKARIKIEMAA